MEGSSIVSRARTAFHSAAAKAERVFTDIKKSDLTTNRDSDEHSPNTASKPESLTPSDHAELKSYHEVKHRRWKPAPIKTKTDWQERLKNIRIGKKGIEETEKAENSTMAFAIFDENLYMMNMRAASELKGSEMGSSAEDVNTRNMGIIPPTTVIKQLAIDVEAGKKFKSMKDLLASSRDSSPVRERASLSFSAVKSLVLRDKEEKLEFGADEKVLSVIHSLLEAGLNAYFGDLLKIFAEGHFPERKIDSCPETPTNMTSLPKDIHGAPPGSFVVELSEAIGTFRTLKKVAFFWFRVVAELRRLWSKGQYVPGIPPDEIPDLNSCLLYQQLQVINCCVSRKRRRSIATESLDSVISHANSNVEESAVSEGMVPASPIFYASISSGELVLRLGADKQFDNLTMLETGEPVYTPVTQEGPLLTEDLIKETEEFVLRTGSVGAGCSQLLSDMQAFKAANPGCILEDFVRWHSPPDWMETEMTNEAEDTVDSSDLLSTRGQLSSRMQKEGNLWRELWETAKPVPAVKQAPLFDEDLAVEGILNILEDIPPSELLEQLFVSLLGSGFVLAEASLRTDGSLSKLFYECKDYIVTTFQGSIWRERVDDICQVYETVETMLLNPDEVLKMLKQPEESSTAGEPKGRFKRLSLIFGGKNWHSGKNQNNSEENSLRSPFSSIFSKKPPKPDSASSAEKPSCSVENDWTFVYKM